MELIDKAAVVAEIEKRISDNKKDIERAQHKNLEDYFEGYEDALVLFKEKFLDTLEVKEIEPTEVPKHSYFETIYHCGTEPMWKVGDILVEYEFYSDCEGEHVYGEVIGVKMDNDYSDWIYTIKGDSGAYEDIYESQLISEQAHRKNK